MKREKKIVLVAHCFLNVNAKVHGLATEAAGCRQIVHNLLDNGFGIVQLPCMEQLCFGINRWGQVKEQMDFPAFRAECRRLLQPITDQALDFYKNGYEIAAVIGVNGSPACGIDDTCTGKWGGEIGEGYDLPAKIASLGTLGEPGVMMEVLRQMFEEANMKVPFVGVDERSPESAATELINQISG